MNKKLSLGIMLGYGTAALSFNFVWGMVSNFIQPYFINVMGISIAATGVIALVARIWDGFNDPIMGSFVDKTNTKYGRYRPYLLFGIVPLVVTTILLFTNPEWSIQAKTAYAAFAYILFGMAYTLANIPYLSMISTMTKDPDERTMMMTVKNIFVMIGVMLPGILVTKIAISAEGYSEAGFQTVAIIGAVLLTVTMLITFFVTKSVKYTGETMASKISWSDRINAVKENKPLLIMMIVMLVFSLQGVLMGAQTLFIVDGLGRGDQAFAFTLLMLPGMFVAMVLMPILKRMEKSKVVSIGMIIYIIGALIFQFSPNSNLTMLKLGTVIKAIGFGFLGIMVFSMIADCVDYARSYTGKQQGGIIFSAVTFVQKAVAGLGAIALSGILILIGFQAKMIGQQTEVAVSGLKMLNGIIPAALAVFVIIGMKYYPLTKAKMAEINKQ